MNIESIEPQLRLGFFLGFIFVFSVFEYAFPYRKTVQFFAKRKLTNFSFAIINTALVRLMSATGLVTVAVYAANKQIGLFNNTNFPAGVELVLSLLVFDLLIYFQHLLMHLWSPLWRLHRLHHSDLEYDLSTALRFHPIEIGLSFIIKLIVTLLMGAPVLSVIIFEIVLSSLAIFSHSNIHIPDRLDSVLRRLIITPNFHRIHHSIRVSETNSNYAFNLTVWDFLFGTYVAKSKVPDDEMPIGIEKFRNEDEQSFSKLLLQPFAD